MIEQVDSSRLKQHLEEVRAVYRELLERDADSSGLQTYGYGLVPINIVVESIKDSPEYARIQRKQKSGGVAIDYVDAEIAVGDRPSTEEGVKLVKSTFSLLVDIAQEPLKNPQDFDSYVHIRATPGAVIPVDEVSIALEAIKNTVESDKGVLIACDDVISSVVVSILWYVSQGLDEDTAKQLVLSMVPSCGLGTINSLVGPWHIEAALALFTE